MEIFVSQLCDYLNRDREQTRDMYTNKQVSKLASVLGFEKKHKMKGTVIMWNDTTIARLQHQYGVIEDEHDGMKEKPTKEGVSVFASE